MASCSERSSGGLAGREEINPRHIAVNETAFRKRHDYVTVVSDQDTGTVLHVGKDRKLRQHSKNSIAA
ncbi:MAG: transposase [Candidatus Thiodiazotropha sp. (ex Lucinoma aequizonata)]|nr:transposase [Candidatus Thiodiazotropha sp. (ex Lucinoma aequizonata)]MCU7894771.1 transposase [Candidatus Thiodiazotropha sp. (ex Lucinoma aequizonata)]MCU7897418.1 transposase [Candidatus Thiodiazotropha sp. (ex Lucinoma aequizonata)]MCU7903663.1 transposase [Candidatus Thiodiazotropha sp. (ex Lucinoma aequizonata)]MCU7907847.1 transposase [Candidatus Thiodiazotropha sp. (ex Lucinoma aequizonata)]